MAITGYSDHSYPSTHSSYQAQAAAVMQAQAAGMGGGGHVGGAMNSSYEQPEVSNFFSRLLLYLTYLFFIMK